MLGTERRLGATLLPIALRPAPLTDCIVLALELAGSRAAEVALSLKVIDVGGVLQHTRSPGQDMPAGGSWHMVWAKAGDHASMAIAHRVTLRATLAIFALEAKMGNVP